MPFKNHHYLPTSRHITYSVAIKHFFRQVTHFGFRGKSNPITKVHYSVWSLIEVVHTTSYHRMKIAWKPLVAQNRDAYLEVSSPEAITSVDDGIFSVFLLRKSGPWNGSGKNSSSSSNVRRGNYAANVLWAITTTIYSRKMVMDEEHTDEKTSK